MLTLLVPMAGKGQRFRDAGYKEPKPFIDVMGKPMIRRVLENVIGERVDHTLLLLQHEHIDLAEKTLRSWLGFSSRPIYGTTEGAACTVLLSEPNIYSGDELLIVNSDQIVSWAPDHFIDFVRKEKADGAIVTAHGSGIQYSYAAVEHGGAVTATAEKDPISNHICAGYFYFRTASLCFDAIKSMMRNTSPIRNEWYLAPCFNEMIIEGKKVIYYPVPKLYSMGTPADLTKTIDSGVFGKGG